MSFSPYAPDELEALEDASGLVFVGYVSAGEPAALVPILVKRERWPERRLLVLSANGRQVDAISSARHAALRGGSSTLADR